LTLRTLSPETTAGAALAHAATLRDVTFRFGDRVALDAITVEFPPGSVFGLLGPNGSGKSTLLSILTGARTPASGAVAVLGGAPTPRLRSRIGVVFQDGSLDPIMTVAETMRLHGRLFGMRREEVDVRSRELLARMRLDDRAASPTATLSGGLKRRLELARALLPGPELLLLDEPTLALDPDARMALWQYLREANAAGCTLILATNDVQEAERNCDRVALLDRGKLVVEDTPGGLKRELRRDSVRIEWRADARGSTPPIDAWEGVGHVRWAGAEAHVTVDDASRFLTRLFREAGEAVRSVWTAESTLEDAYFQLVGHALGPREVDDP
jgi:ABC-2 type transport system ATP-binding protein